MARREIPHAVMPWLRAVKIYLAGACERAEVILGSFDARILAWLANYEPETCAAIAGLISRAYSSGLRARPRRQG